MRTQDGDQIIINIVGHNPDGAINATTMRYMRGVVHVVPPGLAALRTALFKTITQWSEGIAKEQNR